MTQTYDPAAAQANNDARNQEIERAAMPTTKPLTKLADNPDHCRQVWECVTGLPSKTVDMTFEAINSRNEKYKRTRLRGCADNGTVYEVKLWNDGDTISEEDGDAQMFNPFALVALLTKLGYAPTEA